MPDRGRDVHDCYSAPGFLSSLCFFFISTVRAAGGPVPTVEAPPLGAETIGVLWASFISTMRSTGGPCPMVEAPPLGA